MRNGKSRQQSDPPSGGVRLAGWCCVLVMAGMATVALAKSPASNQDLQGVRGMQVESYTKATPQVEGCAI